METQKIGREGVTQAANAHLCTRIAYGEAEQTSPGEALIFIVYEPFSDPQNVKSNFWGEAALETRPVDHLRCSR